MRRADVRHLPEAIQDRLMQYDRIDMPGTGGAIGVNTGLIMAVSDKPAIPFIDGKGIGANMTLAVGRACGAGDVPDQIEGLVAGVTPVRHMEN